MPDLGLNVLLKGKNMARLLGGLWVALRISLLSVAISIPLGILLGVLMSDKNPVVKAILRVYLEIIRIMPQMVLLFLVFFGTTRAGPDEGADLLVHHHSADGAPPDPVEHQPDHPHDQDHQPCADDRRRRGAEGRAADH